MWMVSVKKGKKVRGQSKEKEKEEEDGRLRKSVAMKLTLVGLSGYRSGGGRETEMEDVHKLKQGQKCSRMRGWETLQLFLLRIRIHALLSRARPLTSASVQATALGCRNVKPRQSLPAVSAALAMAHSVSTVPHSSTVPPLARIAEGGAAAERTDDRVWMTQGLFSHATPATHMGLMRCGQSGTIESTLNSAQLLVWKKSPAEGKKIWERTMKSSLSK